MAIIYYLCGKDMKIMRIFLLLAAILVVTTTSAQELVQPFENGQPARRAVVPYGRATDAQSAVSANSNYVAKLAEWSVSADKRLYETSFAVPVWWLNRQVIVRVGHASSAYEVLVDNRRVGYAASGATPVEFNVTKYAKEGRRQLAIRLVDSEHNLINAHHKGAEPSVTDVMVLCQPSLRIRDIVTSTTLNDAGQGLVMVSMVVKCDALNPKRSEINYTLRLNDTTVLTGGSRKVGLDMRREDTVRFSARVPVEGLWSQNNPHRLILDIENKMDNRPAEYIHCQLGVRAADVVDNALHINNSKTTLKLRNYNPQLSLEAHIADGYTGIVIPSYYATDALLDSCDEQGVLVFIQAAICTTALGDNIRLGGNPSNNPFWLNTYLDLNRMAYYSTRHHPSVVGYAIADGTTTGINVYESYLLLKRLETRLPIIYEGNCGEWCSDRVTIR